METDESVGERFSTSRDSLGSVVAPGLKENAGRGAALGFLECLRACSGGAGGGKLVMTAGEAGTDKEAMVV